MMKKPILLVDDEAPVREAIGDILTDEGYRVITAVNGVEALKQLEGSEPLLIITDVVMPDMEGIEFIRKVRKMDKRIPIIVMSGNPLGSRFFTVADMLGAATSLLKPFSKSELLQAIDQAAPGGVSPA